MVEIVTTNCGIFVFEAGRTNRPAFVKWVGREPQAMPDLWFRGDDKLPSICEWFGKGATSPDIFVVEVRNEKLDTICECGRSLERGITKIWDLYVRIPMYKRRDNST